MTSGKGGFLEEPWFMHKDMKDFDTPARYETYRGGFDGFVHAADPFEEKAAENA